MFVNLVPASTKLEIYFCPDTVTLNMLGYLFCPHGGKKKVAINEKAC